MSGAAMPTHIAQWYDYGTRLVSMVEKLDGGERNYVEIHAEEPGDAFDALLRRANVILLEEDERFFIDRVIEECGRAVNKHPSPNPTLAALVDEVGEVERALLQGKPDAVFSECVQVAAMALRIALDGDPTIPGTVEE